MLVVWASKEGRATEWVRGCRSVQEQCRQSRGGQHVLIDSAPRAKRRALRQTGSGFCLARAVKCHEICSPSLFHHFLQAQNIASPKWLPTTYAPGLSKTAACAAYCMDRLPTSCSPLPYCGTPIGHTTSSHNLQSSEPIQGSSSTCTLPFPFPTRFSALHCRSPSLAFVLTSTSELSPL